MSHLPFTIAAYFLNSIAVVIDQFLLNKTIPHPVVYVFYFSAFSLLVLPIAFFVPIPPLWVFVLASLSTLLWTAGAYFMFTGLKIGQASRVVPIIGTLIPLFLLFFYSQVSHTISVNEVWASGFLTLGLIVLILPYLKGKLLAWEFFLELLSALFFAGSYIILHQAYGGASFLSVFVYSRVILIPIGFLLILIPQIRKLIFVKRQYLSMTSSGGRLFILGQAAGGASELLITFSVSLANPALVNSLQGSQYIFLFLLSMLLSFKLPEIFQEKLSFLTVAGKFFGLILISLGLLVLAVSQNIQRVQSQTPPVIGVTYSPKYAKQLKLDPKLTFIQLLDEVGIKRVRLPLYWDEIEKIADYFDFSLIDEYLQEAAKRNVEVILVVGYKQPRWPECFEPRWAKTLPIEKKEQRILNLVLGEVTHFKEFPAITTWQVENEPFLSFGVCSIDPINREKLLEKEIDLIKQLDSRPILISESGELSSWRKGVQISDHLGFTMYRQVWSPLFGEVDYPLFPLYYKLKDETIRRLLNKQDGKSIILELQTEPWPASPQHLSQVPIKNQLKFLSLDKFKGNIQFAKETGFQEIYLWGAEWWFFMKQNGHPEYLEHIKSLVAN